MTIVMIIHSTCGSRVYIGTYIHVPSYEYYLILKLSITASLYSSTVVGCILVCTFLIA